MIYIENGPPSFKLNSLVSSTFPGVPLIKGKVHALTVPWSLCISETYVAEIPFFTFIGADRDKLTSSKQTEIFTFWSCM